jgi:hypothetical protein
MVSIVRNLNIRSCSPYRLAGSDAILSNSVYLCRTGGAMFLSNGGSVWIYLMDMLHTAYGPIVIVTVACVGIKQVALSEVNAVLAFQ